MEPCDSQRAECIVNSCQDAVKKTLVALKLDADVVIGLDDMDEAEVTVAADAAADGAAAEGDEPPAVDAESEISFGM